MKIMKSAEDYLEAMLMMQEKHGYIAMAEDGRISLLPKGQEIAERIYERHRVLTRLFIGLGVDEKTAQEDACKVEHDLSKETFDAIRRWTLEQDGE